MYEDLSSMHSAASVRNRLKYDNLAGRHLEMQAEYESMIEELKKQGPNVRDARRCEVRECQRVSHGFTHAGLLYENLRRDECIPRSVIFIYSWTKLRLRSAIVTSSGQALPCVSISSLLDQKTFAR